MSNRTYNEHATPVLRPDPKHEGRSVDREGSRWWAGAVEPRRGNPSTGFALPQPPSVERSAGR